LPGVAVENVEPCAVRAIAGVEGFYLELEIPGLDKLVGRWASAQ
jgi:hypothetical protein